MEDYSTKIAKIESTFLGYESHGILTAFLQVSYGSSGQGIGGYALDTYNEAAAKRIAHPACGAFVAGVLKACGVDSWEKVAGRTVMVLTEGDGWGAQPVGIAPLPTEKGKPFYFADMPSRGED